MDIGRMRFVVLVFKLTILKDTGVMDVAKTTISEIKVVVFVLCNRQQ